MGDELKPDTDFLDYLEAALAEESKDPEGTEQGLDNPVIGVPDGTNTGKKLYAMYSNDDSPLYKAFVAQKPGD